MSPFHATQTTRYSRCLRDGVNDQPSRDRIPDCEKHTDGQTNARP